MGFLRYHNLWRANTPYGTAFKITPNGTVTTLHSFDGTDGWGPSGGVIQVPTETSTEQRPGLRLVESERSSKLLRQAR